MVAYITGVKSQQYYFTRAKRYDCIVVSIIDIKTLLFRLVPNR